MQNTNSTTEATELIVKPTVVETRMSDSFWTGYDLTLEGNVYECVNFYVNFAETFENPNQVKRNLDKALVEVGWSWSRVQEFWMNVSGKFNDSWVKDALTAQGIRAAKTAFIR